jgi:hypothetical protein
VIGLVGAAHFDVPNTQLFFLAGQTEHRPPAHSIDTKLPRSEASPTHNSVAWQSMRTPTFWPYRECFAAARSTPPSNLFAGGSVDKPSRLRPRVPSLKSNTSKTRQQWKTDCFQSWLSATCPRLSEHMDLQCRKRNKASCDCDCTFTKLDSKQRPS